MLGQHIEQKMRKGSTISTLGLLDRPPTLEPTEFNPLQSREQPPFGVESPPSSYADHLQACADDIRAGRTATLTDLQEIWRLAGLMGISPHGGFFVGPEGEMLNALDAELVWSKRTAAAWTLQDEEGERLLATRDLFWGKQHELDASVPLESLDDVARGRDLLHGLDVPGAYQLSLHELAERAANRLMLSWEILQSQADLLDAPDAQQIDTIRPAPSNEQETHVITAPLERLATIPTPRHARLATPPPRVRTPSQDWQRITGEQNPTVGYRGYVRSHRRVPEWPLRVRRAAAVTLIAVMGLLAFNPKSSPNSSSSVQARAPVVEMPLRPNIQPPAIETPPPEAPSQNTVRLKTPGGPYDPHKRVGAIQFVVEDDAAALGHPNLTLLQTHRLTQRTLDFMGMNWTDARHISPDTQLHFPPEATMRQWIAELTR